jgi:hypothetical protein
MRAWEFITESQSELPSELDSAIPYAFELPGLAGGIPYDNYRFSVAMARARSDSKPDEVNKFKLPWTDITAMGEFAVVIGASDAIEPVIDQALKMTNTKGGRDLITKSPHSMEPKIVNKSSPVKGFKGYKRK